MRTNSTAGQRLKTTTSIDLWPGDRELSHARPGTIAPLPPVASGLLHIGNGPRLHSELIRNASTGKSCMVED